MKSWKLRKHKKLNFSLPRTNSTVLAEQDLHIHSDLYDFPNPDPLIRPSFWKSNVIKKDEILFFKKETFCSVALTSVLC